MLFAILQKYDFSSKSQHYNSNEELVERCLRYCKSTIFQANHNAIGLFNVLFVLFAILQKYDFSSKSQLYYNLFSILKSCLRYCKSTIFQANHNSYPSIKAKNPVVCDTAKVRFFKQITTQLHQDVSLDCCLRYCKSTIFQANHNGFTPYRTPHQVVCDTAKVRFFKQITTIR